MHQRLFAWFLAIKINLSGWSMLAHTLFHRFSPWHWQVEQQTNTHSVVNKSFTIPILNMWQNLLHTIVFVFRVAYRELKDIINGRYWPTNWKKIARDNVPSIYQRTWPLNGRKIGQSSLAAQLCFTYVHICTLWLICAYVIYDWRT
jgi:hypothetical protein